MPKSPWLVIHIHMYYFSVFLNQSLLLGYEKIITQVDLDTEVDRLNMLHFIVHFVDLYFLYIFMIKICNNYLFYDFYIIVPFLKVSKYYLHGSCDGYGFIENTNNELIPKRLLL